jgi:hypothetical protein
MCSPAFKDGGRSSRENFEQVSEGVMASVPDISHALPDHSDPAGASRINRTAIERMRRRCSVDAPACAGALIFDHASIYRRACHLKRHGPAIMPARVRSRAYPGLAL